MTPRPTVSVLLTAFNRERYIGPAIESVLAQTFTDFELIVVDDCSTDGTVEVAQRVSVPTRACGWCRTSETSATTRTGITPRRSPPASI